MIRTRTVKVLALSLATTFVLAATPALADGAKLFKMKCGSCHSMEAGKHKSGPSLADVVGRQAGTTDFKKYKGLKDSDIVWTPENIDAWIANPKSFLGKATAMTAKIRKAEDRAEIIEYLQGS